VAENVGLLTLATKRIKLNFEIHPLFVKLVNADEPEFKHIIDKELNPVVLLMELSKCGVHLLPEDEDAEKG